MGEKEGKLTNKLGVMVCVFNPSGRRLASELEASLLCIASSRPSRATELDSVLKGWKLWKENIFKTLLIVFQYNQPLIHKKKPQGNWYSYNCVLYEFWDFLKILCICTVCIMNRNQAFTL